MAFKFRSKSSLSNQSAKQHASQTTDDQMEVAPKLSNAQLSKLAKLYPPWLKDSSGLKQLPGVYQGVLGQVQLQPSLIFGANSTNGHIFAAYNAGKQLQSADYMNRFTDTERVHQLLSASQLPNETLATIWAHVNKTFPGKLTNREVCLALALIAIFQRLESENHAVSIKMQATDPFSLVKNEKKPPVPILYPNNNHSSSNNNNNGAHNIASSKAQVVPSKSIPTELNSSGLLVDIRDDNGITSSDGGLNLGMGSHPFLSGLNLSNRDDVRAANNTNNIKSGRTINRNLEHLLSLKNIRNNAVNLIDMDGDKFEIEFSKLTQAWLMLLSAMKSVFKRSFDILNVENSRESAIEALKSQKGKQFSKHLCLCYPIAHNIKFKIDELNNLQLNIANEQINLFDKSYIVRIDDLMTSINEYWAVLINLFHESGQTGIIELIMDGLNYKQQTVSSETIEELANELDGCGKRDVCCLCHTKFYLTNYDSLANNRESILSEEDNERILDNNDDDDETLLSEDNLYYYHAKCANFWLNQVDSIECNLPFRKQPEFGILSPATMNR